MALKLSFDMKNLLRRGPKPAKPEREQKVKIMPNNCMNIYPRAEGGIKFEYMAEPTGDMRKCLNNNKWYYVNIKLDGKLTPLTFPDDVFYNPKEMAQVIGAEPFRRFFEYQNTLLEKIAPWSVVGAGGLCLFGMIIFGGS
jgi:hypothetical protein